MMSKMYKYATPPIAILALIVFTFGSIPLQAQDAQEGKEFAQQLSTSFRYAVAHVKPAVVSISAQGKLARPESMAQGEMPEIPEMFKHLFPPDMFQNPRGNGMTPQRTWQGSGVIISSDGEILTNNHVVERADELDVTLDDGRVLEAEVIATDPMTDIALIKLKGGKDYSYANLGDSDQLQVGDWVLAIGNPFGLAQSVSEGIVSAIGRTSDDVPIGGINDEFKIKNYIQTTAAINPGNSGGPLINLNGEVVAINNAIQTAGIAANIGIGFAIPSNLAKDVIDKLKKYGRVPRGYIGVQLSSLSPDVADYYRQEYGISHGAQVQKVFPDTPGEKAGLENGDLILEFNGIRVMNSGQLVNLVTSTNVGEEVELKVLRGGKERTLRMTLAERPKDPDAVTPEDKKASSMTEELLGLAVSDLSSEKAAEMGFAGDVKGVLVTSVTEGSEAARVGIQESDVISEVNDKPIKSVEDFEKSLSDVRASMRESGSSTRSVMLYVHRAKSNLFPRYVAPKITTK